MSNDTICAIASGVGGAIGVVRLSGPAAKHIGQQLLAPWPAQLESHRLYYGKAREPSGPDVLDEVMFCVMGAPRSYTGEDVLEIYAHGSAFTLRWIVDAALDVGARAAEPGEFTRRAFLAGKLDLTRAEAIASLLAAQTSQAARQAQRQLGGELFYAVDELRNQLVQAMASPEHDLDFPDPRETTHHADCLSALTRIAKRLEELLGAFAGVQHASNVEIALVGRANAGKSSLLNALAQSERALVDSIPGTTRDFIEVLVQLGDMQVTLIDTVGERADKTPLESAAMRLVKKRITAVDLVLLVVDGTIGIEFEEQTLLTLWPDKPVLVVWNKIDQAACRPVPQQAIGVSSLCGYGLAKLRERLVQQTAAVAQSGEGLATNARQATALRQAQAAIERARELLVGGQPLDLAVFEMRLALGRINSVVGHEVDEGVLESIFSRFCVGK